MGSLGFLVAFPIMLAVAACGDMHQKKSGSEAPPNPTPNTAEGTIPSGENSNPEKKADETGDAEKKADETGDAEKKADETAVAEAQPTEKKTIEITSSLPATLGQAYDSRAMQLLPATCAKGSIFFSALNPIANMVSYGWSFGTLAAPAPGLADLHLGQLPQAREFVELSGSSEDPRVFSGVAIKSAYLRVGLKEATWIGQDQNCGDKFVRTQEFSQTIGVGLRLEFASDEAAAAFRAEFSPRGIASLQDSARNKEISDFLVENRAKLSLIALQAGGTLGPVAALVEASECSVKNLSACRATIDQIGEVKFSFDPEAADTEAITLETVLKPNSRWLVSHNFIADNGLIPSVQNN